MCLSYWYPITSYLFSLTLPRSLEKVECCVDAIRGGVERVHILDGRIPHSILIELLSDRGIGTMLKREE